jgi:hypothetical protein
MSNLTIFMIVGAVLVLVIIIIVIILYRRSSSATKEYVLQDGVYVPTKDKLGSKELEGFMKCPNEPKRKVINGPHGDICTFDNSKDIIDYCSKNDSCIGYITDNKNYGPVSLAIKIDETHPDYKDAKNLKFYKKP